MSKVDLRLDWVGHDAAKFAVEHWHYSHAMPKSKLAKIGVWENGQFIGVVIFGYGAAPEIGSPFGLEQIKVCELVRVALKPHQSPASRVVALAVRMLKKTNAGLRLIVSFADSAQGHHGGIYQAGNWVYVGAQNYHAYRVKNAIYHPRTLNHLYGVGGQSIPWLRAHVDPNAQRIDTLAKYKYLYPLDNDMRRQIEPLRKPYPKREPANEAT